MRLSADEAAQLHQLLGKVIGSLEAAETAE
jgi:hypothetical protein